MRRIGSEADIKEGIAALTSLCPHLARVHALAGDPPFRKRPKGFEGLARVIVGQQLSIASVEAIWNRVQAAVQPFQPATLLATPEKTLRKAGLSPIHQQRYYFLPCSSTCALAASSAWCLA